MRNLKSILSMGAAMSAIAAMGMQVQRPVRATPRKPKVMVKPEPYKPVVHYVNPDPLQAALNKMTNWQRNQAGRACKGNFRRLTPELLEHFCNLKKPA
jgi:hypothetical protein